LIQRAADAEAGFVEDVSVNHGRGDVFVSEEFLNGADVLAVFKQMSGETVPECMATGGFGNAGMLDGQFDSVLEIFFLEMVPTHVLGARIDR